MSPPTRATDPEGITIDRKIPLWGILTAGAAFLVQAAVMWNGQSLQTQQISDLTKKVDRMIDKQETKDGTDLKQDMQISAILQRLILIEGSKGDKK
jgi:hypothetical protein